MPSIASAPTRHTAPIMNLDAPEPDNILIHMAKVSKGHADEAEFLRVLQEFLDDLDPAEDMDDQHPMFPDSRKWTAAQWRDALAAENHPMTQSGLDTFHDLMADDISEYGDSIASVGYELESMAHSGHNAVIEFCGIYSLVGSDFGEGPSANLEKMLDHLYFTKEEGYDCYIDERYKHMVDPH